MLAQLGQGHTRGSRQRVTDLGHRAMKSEDVGIDLNPVARRENEGLVDVLTTSHSDGQSRGTIRVQGDGFQQCDRRRPVRKSEYNYTHGATSSRGMLWCAAGGLRCSWKART